MHYKNLSMGQSRAIRIDKAIFRISGSVVIAVGPIFATGFLGGLDPDERELAKRVSVGAFRGVPMLMDNHEAPGDGREGFPHSSVFGIGEFPRVDAVFERRATAADAVGKDHDVDEAALAFVGRDEAPVVLGGELGRKLGVLARHEVVLSGVLRGYGAAPGRYRSAGLPRIAAIRFNLLLGRFLLNELFNRHFWWYSPGWKIASRLAGFGPVFLQVPERKTNRVFTLT
jgi:hypothetical protein